MNKKARPLIAAGALLAFLGVVLGAFGAHALKPRIDAELFAVYQTGVQYHLVHAIGIILVGILANGLPISKWLPIAGWTMVGGVLVFSGSLYGLSLTGMRAVGAITPVGGVALLVAWLLLAVGVAKENN